MILWVCILPLAPILYFMLKNECKPKKNIIVGVTLPYEAQRDPEVLALLERYKKELKRMCWLVLLPAVPCLFIRSLAVSLTVWILWIFAACAVLYLPYIRCHKTVKRLKEARGWRRQPDRQTVADLTAAAESMRWLSPVWFLPPLLISLLPLAFERELWWMWIIDAASIPLFYACYRWLYRNRSEVVDGDSGRTMALTRIRRYNWGKCWLILAWATGIFNVGLWLTLEHVWACMAVVFVFCVVVVGAVTAVEFRVRRLQEKLTAGSGQGCYVDEDDHWLWGMLYYNPDDRRLMVNARVGVGTTINLARRSGQVIRPHHGTGAVLYPHGAGAGGVPVAAGEFPCGTDRHGDGDCRHPLPLRIFRGSGGYCAGGTGHRAALHAPCVGNRHGERPYRYLSV